MHITLRELSYDNYMYYIVLYIMWIRNAFPSYIRIIFEYLIMKETLGDIIVFNKSS